MIDALSRKIVAVKIASAISCAVVAGVLSGTAAAQTSADEPAYLTDTSGRVVRSGYDLCWHTGYGPHVYTAECDPAPVKVVDATPPPPPPPPAAKPAGEKITLDADTLFDFDKADLRPAGKQALDEFVEKMKDIDPEVIIAVGHADRLGSDAYNQKLSERRAASVKDYLMGKGIDANRIHTEGKGESQPATKPGECAGAKSPKVIACLQPDRRVEIEVVGTRVVK